MGLFKDLIYISLGKQEKFSRELTEDDWERLYKEAKKQSLVGVLLPGVEKNKPEGRLSRTLINWLGKVSKLEDKNKGVSRRAAELTRIFAEGGFRSCVLKGQGVALLYPNPLRRQCGDIDLWVDGNREEILRFVKKTALKVGKTFVHHIDAEYFDDVSVEIHVRPSYSFSPFRYGKYKRFFDEYKDECMGKGCELGFNCPTLKFNAIYLLLHIFRHVYHEGIGMRQLMDYYYCLEKLSDEERKWAMEKLKWMGLERFAAAIMYVEQKAFALEDEKLLCAPNVKYGRFLLKEIVRVGNFGKYDTTATGLHRVEGSSGAANVIRIVRLYIHNVGRLMGMIGICPSEVLWAPIWKPIHFVWRKLKGY